MREKARSGVGRRKSERMEVQKARQEKQFGRFVLFEGLCLDSGADQKSEL